jgi:hypothetical protein
MPCAKHADIIPRYNQKSVFIYIWKNTWNKRIQGTGTVTGNRNRNREPEQGTGKNNSLLKKNNS